jgi:glycosyltransferase involved in cell wall biosynthesis
MRWIKWTKATEIDDLAEFHIGLMPLQSDQWSDGKCGFKALQYMSLGIATIASPVGVNTTIIQQTENGLLAATSDEWYTALKSLLLDKQKRKELGIAGKQTVEKKYSVNALRSSYLSIINEITTK